MCAARDISALEAKLVSVEAHVVDDDAAAEKRLVDLETDLTWRVCARCTSATFKTSVASARRFQTMRLRSRITYAGWLTAEVGCLPGVFASINKNFASVAIEGVLVMASDSVDLATLQTSAVDSGADVLPGAWDVRRATRVITRRWWPSFSYESALAAIQVRLREVNGRVHCF
jgi:hypothetical protein